ncbi:MAG: 3-hydroxyacyl-CoA dehydrogenase NAD-binding domain-containing protein [Rhodospirillaceae bacterium]|nr:3-hydroxyacyl-CoA dehydrogenase NAD-binding domain-containing protein [Rhodospirillaceae bacterium]
MKLIDRGQVRTIAIVGSGLIGAGWAAWFLAQGFDVRAYDNDPKKEAFLHGLVDDVWPHLERLGFAKDADRKRLTFHHSIEDCVKVADFVQENVLERLDLKQDVIAAVDAALPADRVIASSTSSIIPSELQAKCRHPERVVVGHPFNPPHLIPLVEVVGGAKTDPAAVEWSMAFYDSIGKKAIKLNREIPGHYVNRVQEAMWREVIHCIAEGIVSVEDADIGVAYGPGLRWAIMGPSLTFHLGGGPGGMSYFIEQFGPHIDQSWENLGDPKITPEIQRELIDGTAREAAGRNYRDLVDWRDRCLVGILEAVNKETGKQGKK